MKKNKHPQMHPYEVTLTNGDVITLYTTIPGKKNVKLEIDIFNHPA